MQLYNIPMYQSIRNYVIRAKINRKWTAAKLCHHLLVEQLSTSGLLLNAIFIALPYIVEWMYLC